MIVTQHLSIHGHVQGVFFRESMCREAQRLGITGWVRNRQDGTVEAMVQGLQETVSLIIEWAKSGPEQAQVDEVEITDGSGEYAKFEKLSTT